VGGGVSLLDHHREQLAASAISDELITERGYWSAERKAQLADLGFGRSQQHLPALVMPTYSVAGEPRPPLARPDKPRSKDGRVVKYEIPTGTRMFLDVPPRTRPRLSDPTVPLIFTEGIKKADAAVGHGLYAVTLTGVWNFRGTGEHNGKAVLAELGQLEWIALRDGADRPRQVYVIYDSDVMLKPEVHQAMARLSGVLRERGADIGYVYLPHREGGAKRGLDDAFADGFTRDRILALATPELRAEPKAKPNLARDEPAFAPRTLEEAEEVFREELYLPDTIALRVALATITANRLPARPVWMLLVGVGGCGKTEVVWSLHRLPEVHVCSTLRESALLSGTSEKERAKGATGGVLRELGDRGLVLVKDFTSLLSMRHEVKLEVLSALREVYDGAWDRPLGADGGVKLSWRGHAGFLAGVTPTIDRHSTVTRAMGERFLLLRMPKLDRPAQAAKALRQHGRVEEVQRNLEAAACGVIAGTKDHELRLVSTEAEEELVRLAVYATHARSAVERDGYNREIVIEPEPEAPARFALALRALLDGLGLIGCTRDQAWEAIYRVARDSVPGLRSRCMRRLYEADGQLKTSDVLGELPTSSNRRALEDLTALGMVERDSDPKEHEWLLSEIARTNLDELRASETIFSESSLPRPPSHTRATNRSGKSVSEREGGGRGGIGKDNRGQPKADQQADIFGQNPGPMASPKDER
jgi:Domain of unknown function (DUF3854)